MKKQTQKEEEEEEEEAERAVVSQNQVHGRTARLLCVSANYSACPCFWFLTKILQLPKLPEMPLQVSS